MRLVAMDRKPERENTRLYDAAAEGSVEILNELIKNDQFILNTILLTSFSETPLHISALLGHLEFTETILQRNPNMALELDSLRRSPLHLASAGGHASVVKCLLRVNTDLCLVPDQDGRVPLHLATMRGRVDVIRELINAKPESASMLLDGDTVLHLCVEYNHLDALELLVYTFKDDDAGMLIKGNKDGNTILHLAVKLNQFETVRYLLSVDQLKASVNNLNAAGLTAMDVAMETCSRRSFRSFQIREILMENGAIRAPSYGSNEQNTDIIAESIKPTATSNNNSGPTKALAPRWIVKIFTNDKYWKAQDHGTIMIVATVIATITYQGATNPPGGVWQENIYSNATGSRCSKDFPCLAGTSILASNDDSVYLEFMAYNMISFLASLGAILLIISGMPIENKVATWILTLAMCASLIFLALAYLSSISNITPGGYYNFTKDWVYEYITTSLYIWFSFVGLVGVVHVIRILYWASSNLRLHSLFEKKNSKASQEKASSEVELEERISSQCGSAHV